MWTHPVVIGELACGSPDRRRGILGLWAALPSALVLDDQEVLDFVESRQLMAQGIGWIDVRLLASATLGRFPVWTPDRRLRSVARRPGLTPDLRATRRHGGRGE